MPRPLGVRISRSRAPFSASARSYSVKHLVALETIRGMWREQSGGRITVFDGGVLLSMDEGGDEFVRLKKPSKTEDPLPPLYRAAELDWSKLSEKERRPCDLRGFDHTCVLLEAPIKPWIRGSSSRAVRMHGGPAELLLDTETGLLLAFRTVEDVQGPTDRYRIIASAALRSLAGHSDAHIFQAVSTGRKEVRNLSAWRAGRIQRVLGGKPAPELNVTDMQGNRVSIADLKGKTILLDFWSTWCPPCRDDAPDLEKLHRKYGDRDLAIVGISVGEARRPVEAFLRGRTHDFPNILAIEHDLPRPYQVEVLPTYIVIDRNGNVSAATEGDQGFTELRRLLKKAGLDVD